MPKKPIFSQAELTNDPSLKYCPYRTYELVWSDDHGCCVRFLKYTKAGRVKLAGQDTMGELTGSVRKLSIRRPSVMDGYTTTTQKE